MKEPKACGKQISRGRESRENNAPQGAQKTVPPEEQSSERESSCRERLAVYLFTRAEANTAHRRGTPCTSCRRATEKCTLRDMAQKKIVTHDGIIMHVRGKF